MYKKNDKPTIYFIGVTTTQSSIMRIFPQWMSFLHMEDYQICGIDLKIHDKAENYRAVIQHIKDDKQALGAVVTSHKIDLMNACRDLFDEFEQAAEILGEVSCIYKHGHKLIGSALDPLTSGLALSTIIHEGYWQKTKGEVLVLGAGGSAAAITWHLINELPKEECPPITVIEINYKRLKELEKIHKQMKHAVNIKYCHTESVKDNDRIVNSLPPGSLLINATGLGKDAPGSPLTDAVRFPQNAIVWDFNARGDLVFLEQARAQQKLLNLQVVNGWTYFIYGWTQHIARICNIQIPTRGVMFEKLMNIAQ